MNKKLTPLSPEDLDKLAGGELPPDLPDEITWPDGTHQKFFASYVCPYCGTDFTFSCGYIGYVSKNDVIICQRCGEYVHVVW